MTVHPIGTRCDYNEETDSGIIRCPSTNAKFIPSYQGNLCMVHEAALKQAKAAHPAGKARAVTHYQEMAREAAGLPDPTEVIRILADEIKTANSREALGGYFDHLAGDEKLTRAVTLYAGVDLGPLCADDED